MKILGIEFDKEFRKQYLISSIIASVLGFFIYVFMHNKITFDWQEVILQIPVTFFLVFTLTLIFGFILNERDEE